MTFNNPIIQRRLYLILFVIYTVLVLAGVFHHESWADEAQAWLLVRDNSFLQLLRILPSEGHPPLWYLLHFPIAKAGIPYGITKWISAIAMICTVFIFLFKTSIHTLLKITLPFCYICLYQYALFGRSYALIFLFIALVVYLYPKRFEKPFLFALCIIGLYNTHVLIFSFCFGLTALFITDAIQFKKTNRTIIFCFLLMCAGGWYLIPYLAANDMVSFFQTNLKDENTGFQYIIAHGLLHIQEYQLSLVLFFALAICLIKQSKAFLLLLSALAGVFYILTYNYNGNYIHQSILFVIIFSSYSISVFYQEDNLNVLGGLRQNLNTYGSWLLAFTVAIQAPTTYKVYIEDINRLYSDARNAAVYIKSNTDKNTIIVAQQAMATSSVLPYMPWKTKFFYPECGRYGTYYIYDSCFINQKWMAAVDYGVNIAYSNFTDSLDNLVFLFNCPVLPQTEKYLDLIYTSAEQAIRWDETFYIYKFKENVK